MNMKKRFITIAFILTFSNSLLADQYTLPQIEFKAQKTKKVKVVKEEWDSATTYRVQERPEGERNIASEKKKGIKLFRDPSSTKKYKIIPTWKFKGMGRDY